MAELPSKSIPFYELSASRWKWADHGKCLTCGLLAEAEGSADIEIRISDRETGLHVNGGPIRPFCFINAADLVGEAIVSQDDPNRFAIGRIAADVVANDRHCAEWYPYTPGASPLWHHEERRMMHLEELRALREKEMAELRRQAEADSKAIAEALKDAAIATGRFTTKWTYVAVGVAVAALILVAVAYVFPGLGPTVGHWLNPAWAPTPRP